MKKEISIVLPCYNEEQSLGFCIDEIREVCRKNQLNLEIIVVDNASTDTSRDIIKEKNVKCVKEENRGYGNAYLRGFKSARGEIIIMADCDGSYDFHDLPKFLIKLKENDLVVGNRLNKHLLPILNRIGGFFINRLLRLNGLSIKESCTGFIGIKKDKLLSLNLQETGMEFSSELLVKANKNKLKIEEININFRPRIGKSKLRRFRDGWRHIRYLLLKNENCNFS